MIAHHIHTKPNNDPPIKFYKIIAVSFLLLAIIVLGITMLITSKKASIIILAKEDTKTVNLTANLIPPTQTKDSSSLLGTVTSTVFKWSEKYYPTTYKDVNGISGGQVVIYNKSNLPQALIKTTRLLNPDNVLFRLSQNVTVPANGQVTTMVYADQAGASSDINPSTFIIPGLNAAKQKLIYAANLSPMTGGTIKKGVLSDKDLSDAQADYQEKVKQQFATTIANNSSLGNQKIVVVASVSSTASNKVGDTISEFTIDGNNKMVVIAFNKEDLNDIISKELSKKIDTESEKILSTEDPQVSVLSYDLNKGTAQLSIAENATVTIDANANKLATQNFTNKTKDEVQKYVMGLDHVSGVDLKISPSFSNTTPNLARRITVIVKNVN